MLTQEQLQAEGQCSCREVVESYSEAPLGVSIFAVAAIYIWGGGTPFLLLPQKGVPVVGLCVRFEF